MATKNDFAVEVENYAYAYEKALSASPTARVEDFVPPRSHEHYDQIVVELLRIDLEARWQQRFAPSLDHYRRCFPDVLAQSDRLAPLAYEEYRQRIEAGERVNPREYETCYGVDSKDWPQLSSGEACADDDADATADDLPVAGEQFADFELLEELGRGSFARVFLARQRGLAGRLVALKISRGSSAEPDRLAQLQHANIVPIYSVHTERGLEAVCMPYLGRQTLADVLDQTRRAGRRPRSGQEFLSTIADAGNTLAAAPSEGLENPGISPPPERQLAPSIRERLANANYIDASAWIVARLASGLSHAHDRGILHRDLKPANVLLSSDGRPMILDFNLSDRVHPVGGRPAAVGGTLPYMSPEQLLALETGNPVDERSDVFSLGVIFYELLTGTLPFTTPGRSSVNLAAVAAARRVDMRRMRSNLTDIPRSLANVVQRCLAHSPADRYQSAQQLCEDLDAHLENRPLQHAADRWTKERLVKWARRHPRLSSAASIGALATAVLVAAAFGWVGRERQLRRLHAKDVFRDFVQQAAEARIPLSLVDVEGEAYRDGIAAARSQLERYGMLETRDWRAGPLYRDLEPAEQLSLTREAFTTFYAIAAASLRLAQATESFEVKNSLLDEARWFNGKAGELVEGKPAFAAAVRRQAATIEGRGDGTAAQGATAHLTDKVGAEAELTAIELIQQGRYAAALPALVEWRNQAPTDITAWMLLGAAYAGTGNPREAEACFSACAHLRPGFAETYYQRGLARLQQHQYAAAIEDFTNYAKLKGTSPAALINRALAYQALEKHKSAIADLNAAIAAGAPQTRILFIRAASRRALGDLAGARSDVDEGLSRTPVDAKSWVARGMARLADAPELALEDFRQALKLDPGNRTAAQNALHVLSDRLRREDEALRLVNDVLARNPQDSRALLTRAVVRARLGQAKEAAADAKAALAIDHSPRASLQAACALARLSATRPEYRAMALALAARALGAQPELASTARTDPDLEPIRPRAEFERLLEAAETIRAGGVSGEEEAVALR